MCGSNPFYLLFLSSNTVFMGSWAAARAVHQYCIDAFFLCFLTVEQIGVYGFWLLCQAIYRSQTPQGTRLWRHKIQALAAFSNQADQPGLLSDMTPLNTVCKSFQVEDQQNCKGREVSRLYFLQRCRALKGSRIRRFLSLGHRWHIHSPKFKISKQSCIQKVRSGLLFPAWSWQKTNWR